MKVTHLGTQLIDFTPQDRNEPVQGAKIHYYFEDPDASQWIGFCVSNVFVRKDNPLYKKACTMVSGTDYNLVYEFNGRRAFLSDIVPLDD